MRFEEAYLVLAVDRRSVCIVVHYAAAKLACLSDRSELAGWQAAPETYTSFDNPKALK